MDNRNQFWWDTGTDFRKEFGQRKLVDTYGGGFFDTFGNERGGPIIERLETASGVTLACFKRERKDVTITMAHSWKGVI